MATKGGHGGSSRPSPSFLITPPVLMMLLALLLVVVSGRQASAAARPSESLEQKCASEVGAKLVDCLAYAKGDEATPSRKCCASSTDIRGTDPACFCYIIQQTYEGKPSFKGLGLQLPRLLQLPTVCNIPNSNITDCPRLLNIPPTSTDYAIFNGSATPNGGVGPSSTGVVNQVQYTFAMATATISAIALSMLSS
ncbi:hypothetical protein Taro_021994 [Colocasia esculenta]|uniref:Bifunctional inhibitor/plant lipid transfer protein/seed storage helical domain-containing protein n=1 Tax=Colocasia esculenta TaxID=4460 RepID=A0A843V2Q5_COLES|nr:hypothetical protein [Colocasia esculenta]